MEPDDELLALSWSLNEARRHLTTSQRACAAAEVAERNGAKHGGARTKGKKDSSPKIGACFKVGEESIRMARELLRESPEIFSQVKAAKAVGVPFGNPECRNVALNWTFEKWTFGRFQPKRDAPGFNMGDFDRGLRCLDPTSQRPAVSR